jgi:hypothetical protein
MTTLCQIAARLNCDKCPAIGHNYTETYSRIIPRTARNLLEIGIGSPRIMQHVAGYRPGAGLRMWAEWIDGEVYGVDIDEDCAYVSGERIHVRIADATKADPFPEVEEWDVIIDDGSHWIDHQIASMILLLPKLAKGGVYVVEDVRQPAPLIALAMELGFATTTYDFRDINPMTGDNRLVVIQ